MGKKDEFCLINAEINENYKDQFLIELSNINSVHIKPKKKSNIKDESQEKNLFREKIKDLRKNLNNLFNRLNITETDISELRVKKEKRVEFVAKDLYELIFHLLEEIDFFTNRVTELKSYISKGKIELENLTILRFCYRYLSKLNLNRKNLDSVSEFNIRIFSTFSKNLTNLQNLFDFSEFPNFYETFEISKDRIGFYIIYPKDKQNEFIGKIRLIHSEEVPILKKYLTDVGINFTRLEKEIKYIENLIIRYEKEQNRLRQENLLKFAGINEIVQNIEEYNWAEEQFEWLSSNRFSLKFFVPIFKKIEIQNYLVDIFKENIKIETIDVSKNRPVFESAIVKKKIKKRSSSTKLKENNDEEIDINEEDEEKEDLRKKTPTIMKNFFLARPFEAITKMYGTPAYSEIDPTPIIAITFPLLFGLMFGDIGHGLTLIIAGLIGALLFRKRKKKLANFSLIILYCGFAAFFVGFLYGEFFGYHEIEIFGNVLWSFEEKPITIPIINLKLNNPLANFRSVFPFAIFIGIFYIMLGWFIQFLNYWKQHRKYLAFSDSVMKIFFLLGGTILIFRYGFNLDVWFTFPYPIILVLIPGILLILSKPLGKILKVSYLQKESIGGLLGEGSIETFDTLLSVMSNVLSYIRILALALAHIALLLAINQMGTLIKGNDAWSATIRLVGAIFGNLVVIVIEGLIVFINTLRLHYYEFFYKFFQGSGFEYFPFYLDNNYSIMQFSGGIEKDIISEEIEKAFDTKIIQEELAKAKKLISKKFE